MQLMEADTLLSSLSIRHVVNNRVTKRMSELGAMQVLKNIVMALVCIATLFAIMILLTECLTYVLQVSAMGYKYRQHEVSSSISDVGLHISPYYIGDVASTGFMFSFNWIGFAQSNNFAL